MPAAPDPQEDSLSSTVHLDDRTTAAPETTDGIPFTHALVALWVRRGLIAVASVTGLVAGVALALLLPSKYTSTASLMPPDASTLTQPSSLSQLAGPTLSLGGGLTSQRTPGSTVIGILASRSERDALIDRFDLLRFYATASRETARQRLAAGSAFEEDKKSGIVSITVTEEDRTLARNIAQGYVDELNTLLNKVNTSSAQKEHLFLEARLADIRIQLDRSSAALSDFSSRHETLNPAGQGAALIQSQTLLQNQVGVAESELSALRATYSDGNARVKAAEARVGSLHARLNSMSARPLEGDAERTPGAPSLRQLPMLAVTYANLSRQIATDQAIYEALTKQLEIAKVQEAKELPAAKELDAPALAERRSAPHRTMLALAGLVLGAIGAATYIVCAVAWRHFDRHYSLVSYLASLVRAERNGHGSA